jgi:glucosamine--fructose-6-phosphate aminotransferase (isomerizing)
MAGRSVLESEAAETPALAAQQFERLTRELPVLVARLDHLAPALVATIARGSSDHAAAFAGYLFGLQMGLPTASVPPSIASVYGRTLRLDKALVLAISQSGASPDLCAAAESAKAAGAFTLGLINMAESALGRAVEAQIETGAGNERAVAATKSFILTLTALVHLVAAWSRNASLLRALESLPATLAQCESVDWDAAMRLLEGQEDVFVVGRGPALPVAREFALKLKEVCGIHAEAMSAAEMLHGPISIASPSLPAIVLAGDRYARPTVEAVVSRLRAAGAPVVLVGTGSKTAQEASTIVAIPQAPDPLLEPVVAAQAAYPFFAALARARGKDPDCSPHIRKITRTI